MGQSSELVTILLGKGEQGKVRRKEDAVSGDAGHNGGWNRPITY